MKDKDKTKEQLIGELTGLRQRIAEMETPVEGCTEETLWNNEAQIKAILDALIDRVRLTDKDRRIIWANQKHTKDLNMVPEDLVGKTCYEVFMGRGSPCPECPDKKTLKTGKVEHSVLARLQPGIEGGKKYLDSYAVPLKNESGEIVNIMQISRDITEQRLAEEKLRESEEMYCILVEHSLQGIVIIQDAHIVFANAAFTEISGYTRDELLSLSPDEVRAMIHPGDQALVWGRFQARLEGKPAPPRYEYRGIRKDGMVHWLEMVVNRIEFRGKFAIQGGIVDVTDRKRAEEALLESEEKYRLFVESVNEGIVLTQDGKITYINPQALEVMGYSEKEIISRNLMEFVHHDDREGVLELYFQKLKGEDVSPPTFRIIDKDGSTRWVESRSTVLTYEGKPALLTFLIDITERKRAEEALRNAEDKYRTVFENTGMATVIIEEDTTLSLVNEEFATLCGYPKEEIEGKKWWTEFVVEEDLPRMKEYHRLRRIGDKNAPENYEFRFKDRYSKDRDIFLTAATIPGTKKSVASLLDITERKRAEEALRESEERYRSLFDRLPVGVFQSTPDGWFLDANPAFTRLLGCPDLETLLSTPVITFYRDPEERKQWKKLTEKESGSFAMELQWQKLDGTPFWVRESARVVRDRRGRVQYYEGVAEDITEIKRAEVEQRKLETQLHYAQRMEAIGTLAGGIAHDFNNILSAIMGYTEIALFHDPSEDSPARQSLEQVLVAGERAKDLVKQILAFSRQAEEEHRPVLLEPLAKEALKLVRATLPSTIEIRQSIVPHAGSVMADPTQIHQVLMNLCTNAYHAMRKKGGVLKVSIEDVELGPDYTAKHLDIHPGPYIKLTVSDTGHGIEKKNIDRIFEPYFTTKERGEGTGMGLAVVHGIVKDHGGSIIVYSEPGKGTAFNVFLPRIEVAEVEAKPEEIPPLSMGRERILFVDDEPTLVDLGKRMLEHLGYQVEVRTSPIEALEAFRTQPNKFDLVITDMTMPKMTGDELVKEFMAIRSDIPIILCTGFSERITKEKAKAIGIRAFVMKPFVIRDLANTIRKVLDQEKEK